MRLPNAESVVFVTPVPLFWELLGNADGVFKDELSAIIFSHTYLRTIRFFLSFLSTPDATVLIL